MATNKTNNNTPATSENTTIVKRGRGGKYNFPNTIDPDSIEPGTNSAYVRHALASWNLPPIDIADPRQVEERIGWYFNHCVEDDMKPTVKGFCNALGISRQTLFVWRTGKFREETHQAIICRAYDLLEEMWESNMANGKINPVSGIFLGKNNFGYRDQQEYVVTPNQMGETVSPDIIDAKYDELPEG